MVVVEMAWTEWWKLHYKLITCVYHLITSWCDDYVPVGGEEIIVWSRKELANSFIT